MVSVLELKFCEEQWIERSLDTDDLIMWVIKDIL
jgi:hypothetical protein